MSTSFQRSAAKIFTLLMPAAIIWAYMIGPDPRNTGAPGDDTCAQAGCHAGAPNSGPGKVEITFPAGEVYIPGTKQLWTVTVRDPDAQVYGFQATARPASDNQFGQAGSFVVTDPTTAWVICDDGGERSGDACPPAIPTEFIEHRIPLESGAYSFEWTAPAEDIGDVEVYIAANAANGDDEPRGDRIYTSSYTLRPANFSAAPAIRDTQPVLQAFDNSERLSSGTWIQVYGENFTPSPDYARQWNTGDFDGNSAPQSLDNVRVLVNGRDSFVSYLGHNQINAQVDDDEAEGDVSVQVVTPAGASNEVRAVKTAVTPALQSNAAFVSGDTSYVVAFFPDFQTFVGPAGLIPGFNFRPAQSGETIIVYAVGCGPSFPATPAGQIPATSPPLALPYEFRFGETVAEATGVLVSPFIGLYQFAVKVPAVSGDVDFELTVNGVPAGQGLRTSIAP